MHLEKGSTARLFFSIALSALLLLLYGWLAISQHGIVRIVSLVVCYYSVVNMLIIHALLNSPGPLVSAGHKGLVFNSAISRRELIPWEEVKDIRSFRLHYGLLVIPFFGDYVVYKPRREEGRLQPIRSTKL